jgi:hypothetical protein
LDSTTGEVLERASELADVEPLPGIGVEDLHGRDKPRPNRDTASCRLGDVALVYAKPMGSRVIGGPEVVYVASPTRIHIDWALARRH